MNEQNQAVRIDKWLWAARFFKTRSQAAQAVTGGKVHLNGQRVKAAHAVHIDDQLLIRCEQGDFAVVVLARMGVVSIEKLKNFRGYFIVIAFVIAAIVTPPDVVSQLALAVPMCILYEIGIWAAQLFIKHTKAPNAAEEETASS